MDKQETEKLLEIYRNELTDDEKNVLKISAFCYMDISLQTLGQKAGNRISTSVLRKNYLALKEKGFIRKEERDYILAKEVALTVLYDAFHDMDFTEQLRYIKQSENNYFYWRNSAYKHLVDLFVKHYLKIGPENIAASAQYYIALYFDYLAPIVSNPQFAWLFKEFGEGPLCHLLNVKAQDLRNILSSPDSVIAFERYLRDIPGLFIQNTANNFMMACYAMLDGNFELMEERARAIPEKSRSEMLSGQVYALYKNDTATATQAMQKMLISRKKSEMFNNFETFYIVYYTLSLLSSDAEEYMPQVQKLLGKDCTHVNYAHVVASAMMLHASGKKTGAEKMIQYAGLTFSSNSKLDGLFMFIAACYTESSLDLRFASIGSELAELTTNNGYKLLALELTYALWQIYKKKEFESRYQALSAELKLTAILSRVQRRENWELMLSSLLGAVSTESSGKKAVAEKSTRIVYFVDPSRHIIQPTLQTGTAGGGWTKGRNISLKRLKEKDVEGMTEQDHRIADTLEVSRSYGGYWGADDVSFSDKVWPALAGHPYLFWSNNPDIPIELTKAQPAVTVEETDKGFVLKTDINPGDNNFVIQKETNTRYKLIEIDNRQRTILQTINQGSLTVPKSGKEKLLQALEGMSGFLTIHSDMAETRQGTRTVEGDSRIRVQLLPLGNSLKAELFVKPFGSVPPYCKPGVGGQNIIGTVDNERCLVSRDLKTETRFADAILQEIQQSSDIDTTQEPIVFDDPRDSLYLLEILSKHKDIAVAEWPEGARFKVNRTASMSRINLSVKGVDYWFELDGDLRVDENTVLSLKQLLELNAKAHGRFIELGDGEFLALSNDLKKRLDDLQAYTHVANNRIEMSRFASLSFMEMFEQAGSFKGDKKWTAFRKQLFEAGEIQPAVPKTLQAELRPYQEDGFRWMTRLSEWGAGACLADDMGLGKTVQALAVLLSRAEKGPALIVCPASVVHNWVSEIGKFAPTLNVLLPGNGNREETLDKANAFDAVIVTYGLLQSEEELFAKKKWATAVLDEAHAIKNYNTKTSKAAMNLNADFRLIMTGTPVQNHLGEVWNLFRFINPGLLGNMQEFNDRFVKPTEDGGKRLKKLIAPFILRRTKNNVLEELPPKTEIVKQIDLSDNERVFYEALRRRAIENLQQTSGPAGQQHVKALAEITRLRLACCNPELVEPDVKISSSKLSTFMEIVDELRGNNHRALVFSQFVKHLSVVRRELDAQKIKYKYLDGSTPPVERERNVRDFQAGEGELFLISLKAGGLGLNLTAADFVIHLDPWWNPAIEDQASDRAHRIGQKRPITVYRLVAQHTIEEKIIRLHNTKRDIADSLLEGADAPGKLSTDELLKLIMEE